MDKYKDTKKHLEYNFIRYPYLFEYNNYPLPENSNLICKTLKCWITKHKLVSYYTDNGTGHIFINNPVKQFKS
jgi:hypothetical protein